MKKILEIYNNFNDAVVRKVVFSYNNPQQNDLDISLEIECYNNVENNWQLVRLVFKEVKEYAITSNHVIYELNVMQEDDNTFVDLYFGQKMPLEKIKNESKFYICFKHVEELVLVTYNK